jgi:hypothetical protein
MRITDDRYERDRSRLQLALRMIRHEARTQTIRACTGLSDDRIRKLYKSYVADDATEIRRRRGKSPQQVTYFIRNAATQLEASVLASMFVCFGLVKDASAEVRGKLREEASGLPVGPAAWMGERFCDAYELHQQLFAEATLSFEHAWFLWRLLQAGTDLLLAPCGRCESLYVADALRVQPSACPVCKLKHGVIPAKSSRSARGPVTGPIAPKSALG